MTAELDPTTAPTWSTDELDSIRDALLASVVRLEAEIALMDPESAQSASAAAAEVLHDELDVASQRAELLHDAVQAANAAAILEQTQHVLDRLTAGLYGVCESCSGEIARPRLEAFPRATVCITCAR